MSRDAVAVEVAGDRDRIRGAEHFLAQHDDVVAVDRGQRPAAAVERHILPAGGVDLRRSELEAHLAPASCSAASRRSRRSSAT